jgi:FdhD protein
MIISIEDVESLDLNEKTTTIRIKTKKKPEITRETVFGKRIITSGCGKGMTFFDYRDFNQCEKISSTIKVPAERILQLMNEFQKMSALFLETGGVHSAALADEEGIIVFAEDLGRHNALDKVFGEALSKGIRLSDKIILSSGRLSSEITIKALKRGIPILASPSAPTNLAIELARQLGLTMLGFVRGKRLNIYSGSERLM